MARVVGWDVDRAALEGARARGFVHEVADSPEGAAGDVTVLAVPVRALRELAARARGDVITDVGSTKVMPHQWAERQLDKRARYVGSHPVAGSEQKGVEFARDDLFYQARCVLTATQATDRAAVRSLKTFWSAFGCSIQVMDPVQHDRIFANISHVPHVLAAGLVNASDGDDMKFAGKGFLDSTRIASGPPTVWTDVLMANSENIANGIERTIAELQKLQTAIRSNAREEIERLLAAAQEKRSALVKYKIRRKELL